LRILITKNSKKKGRKIKKMRIFGEILKNGVAGDSDNAVFIGLICFWAKNEGKNECFFALFCVFFAKMNVF
jgi:hypothetical protein